MEKQHIDEEHWLTPIPRKPKPSIWLKLVTTITFSTSVMALLFFLVPLITAWHAQPDRHEPGTYCGDTLSKALTNGCIFDEMLNGWVPPRCHNATMAQEALRDDSELARLHAAGHFPWYEDQNFTTPLSSSLEKFLQTERSGLVAYTWERWHMAHCLYAWRIMSNTMSRLRNGEKNVWANVRTVDEAHIGHCNNVTAANMYRTHAKSIVYFGFGECVRLS